MKRAILGILLLMVILLGTRQASYAITLNYLSGGVSASVNLDGNYNSQYGTNSAQASGYAYGPIEYSQCIARASADAVMDGGFSCYFYSSVDNYMMDGYYVMAASTTQNVFFQVTEEPGDIGKLGQLNYSYANFGYNNIGGWETNFYPEFVITVNGATVFSKSCLIDSSGIINVEVGDIIGLVCGTLSDNLLYTGGVSTGGNYNDFYAQLYVEPLNVEPVPIPPAVLLFGSGLLGLAGWRRFKKYQG